MATIHLLSSPTDAETEADRLPYSFDMSQANAGGMVLIDACVPAAMAAAFLKLLEEFFAN